MKENSKKVEKPKMRISHVLVPPVSEKTWKAIRRSEEAKRRIKDKSPFD